MIDVPVLIVGAGPVGLTASILLGRFGVPSLLVERHPGTSIHPKARAINARTMEIFRQCGVEDAVRAAGLAADRAQFIIWTSSLAGAELERRVPWRARQAGIDLSPVRSCICAQDDLEPVLRAYAEKLGPSTLRFDTELVAFDRTADHVIATLRERGVELRVRARWVIAADGAHSRARESLGIAMQGTPALYRSINVLLRADLTRWVADRPAALYFVEQPDLTATFLTINGVNRWGFLINDLPVTSAAEDYTPERCAAIVRQAVGVPDIDVEILGVAPWVAAALVAERYRDGAVFLAGDAAHHMPPTGGFGLNTGVQDAHNLAWKIAAVHHGWASASLLDTYEAERLPWGRFVTEESLANAISMGRGRGDRARGASRARPEYLNEQGLIFGASYESHAVIADGTSRPPVENPVSQYLPGARPGARAAHAWLERDGGRMSTIDLFGSSFVLLAGREGAAWCEAARRRAHALGIPLEALVVGRKADVRNPDDTWATLYGVDASGAVLVRPDGHVGWRSASRADDPHAEIDTALRGITGRAAARATSRTPTLFAS